MGVAKRPQQFVFNLISKGKSGWHNVGVEGGVAWWRGASRRPRQKKSNLIMQGQCWPCNPKVSGSIAGNLKKLLILDENSWTHNKIIKPLFRWPSG